MLERIGLLRGRSDRFNTVVVGLRWDDQYRVSIPSSLKCVEFLWLFESHWDRAVRMSENGFLKRL